MSALTTATTGSAWRSVPITYVYTRQDYSVPSVYQDIMIENVRSEGVVPRIEKYDTNHGVFITRQQEMAQAVVKAAEDERNPI